MKKLLFVCHGNICRSPMAEFFMADLLEKRGLSHRFSVSSAATSREELGNPVYPPAQAVLRAHGLEPGGKTARQLTKEDYEAHHYLIAMDRQNLQNMRRICGGDPGGKIFRLLDVTDDPGDIADPWYSGDFTQTWMDVTRGCQALLKRLVKDD